MLTRQISRTTHRLVAALLVAAAALLPGCIPIGSTRSTLGVARSQGYAALKSMTADPRPLARPLVVINGYHTPNFHSSSLARRLAKSTSGNAGDLLVLSYPFSSDIRDMASRVVEEVNGRWPSDDPAATVEVDVIGISMGGIVARWAALEAAVRIGAEAPDAAGATRRLKIARLFTFATPHRGARIADWIRPDTAASQMHAGSRLLRALDGSPMDYELICYAQRGDFIVGADRSSPPGATAFVSDGTLLFSHLSIVENPVFVADVARRLRGESPMIVPRPVAFD